MYGKIALFKKVKWFSLINQHAVASRDWQKWWLVIITMSTEPKVK